MIFTLAIVLTICGFHNYQVEGFTIAAILVFSMALNFSLSCGACGQKRKDSFDKHQLKVYILLTVSLFGLALYWYFYIQTSIEQGTWLFERLMMSFVYLGIGFGFYVGHFPQRYSKHYLIQVCFHSHVWWHLFVSLAGYNFF